MDFKKWKKKKQYTATVNGKYYTVNHPQNVFIMDGIICEEQWKSQQIRPLFLLKEAYHKENVPFWNLIDDCLIHNDYHAPTMWKRISEWTYAIFNTTKKQIAKYDPTLWYGKLDFDHHYNEYLKRIAIVNVKKSNGIEKSDKDEIQVYAEYDKEELKQQIEEINPTIIICGNTVDYLEIIFDEHFTKENYNDNWFYFYKLDNGNEILIIDYYHPANQYPKLLNYYGIANIYQQSLLQRNR